ncbi:hypothetical protein L7F22_059858 [Adiantum nelumboides]|nr:hypothetical protein [Adiantum nelumboides]
MVSTRRNKNVSTLQGQILEDILAVLDAQIKGQRVSRVYVDGGAQMCVISEKMMHKLELEVSGLSEFQAKMANNVFVKCVGVVTVCGIQVGVDMYVLPAKGEGYPIILGRPWLIAMNARQDWELGTLLLKPPRKKGKIVPTIVYTMTEGRRESFEFETSKDEWSTEDLSSMAEVTSSVSDSESAKASSLEVMDVVLTRPTTEDGDNNEDEIATFKDALRKTFEISDLGNCSVIKEMAYTNGILNHIVGTYTKPHVALLDGIVMGGSAGISILGSIRVVTEKTVFSMPETAIGFHPPTGASHFLSRLPGFLGEYVGLTGCQINGAEMLACGLATHFVPSKLMENAEVADDLIQGKPDEDGFKTRRKEPQGKQFSAKGNVTSRLTVPPFKKKPFVGSRPFAGNRPFNTENRPNAENQRFRPPFFFQDRDKDSKGISLNKDDKSDRKGKKPKPSAGLVPDLVGDQQNVDATELCTAWGKVRDQEVLVFFDLGARANFISPELASKLGIRAEEMGMTGEAGLACPVHSKAVTPILGKLRLHIQSYVDARLYIFNSLFDVEKALKFFSNGHVRDVSSLVNQYTETQANQQGKSLLHRLEEINSCFSKSTVEKILEELDFQGDGCHGWYKASAKLLRRASPLSLKITLKSIREGRHQSLADCLKREHRLSIRCLDGNISRDFYECLGDDGGGASLNIVKNLAARRPGDRGLVSFETAAGPAVGLAVIETRP